jgi:tetratricopeptide (TPR) repeat protein
MNATMRAFLPAALAALFLSACAVPGTAPEKKAEPPAITEQMLRERAREQFAAGQKQYEAGDYDSAAKSFNGALEHGMLAKGDQSMARKYLAFIACVSNREAQCREEFRRALEIDGSFDLTPAEAGHPLWGPVFRSVKAQMEEQRAALAAKNAPPLPKAEQLLAEGLKKYDAGEYDAALKLLQDASKEGLKDKRDQDLAVPRRVHAHLRHRSRVRPDAGRNRAPLVEQDLRAGQGAMEAGAGQGGPRREGEGRPGTACHGLRAGEEAVTGRDPPGTAVRGVRP